MPRLTLAEERQLAASARHGCVESRHRLVEANLGFAVRTAWEFAGLGVPLDDLINAANLGLVEAAARFDGTRGNRFVTYAVWWIRKTIIRTLHQSPIVRASQYSHRQRRLDPERWTTPAPFTVSLDAPLSEADSRPLAEQLDDPSAIDPERDAILAQQLARLRSAIERLDPRERFVVAARYGFDGQEPLTCAEIGTALNLSRERVRQIEALAIARLRRSVDDRRGQRTVTARLPAPRERSSTQRVKRSASTASGSTAR